LWKSTYEKSYESNPDILADCVKADLQLNNLYWLYFFSCRVKASLSVPCCFHTSEGYTWQKTGNRILPYFALHSTIFTSSSKHQCEDAKFGENMTNEMNDFSIAPKSSDISPPPLSFLSEKTTICFRDNASRTWLRKLLRISLPLKLTKTSYFI